MELTVTKVHGSEMAALARALKQAGLPASDIDEPGRNFFGVNDTNGRLIGYGGLEGAGDDQLLRSVVIVDAHRGRGLGRRLVEAIELEAAGLGAHRLHLLTTTAADFFRKLNYAEGNRTDAPLSIAESEQFRSLCPANAAYLVKAI